MIEKINVSPFSSLVSSISDAVCLPCTDGTWIQLDFYPSGPQIVQMTGRDGEPDATYVKHIEADPETFKELFRPFFFRDAEESGMDAEIFSLMKLQYCYWCMYQIANRNYIRAMEPESEEPEEESLNVDM